MAVKNYDGKWQGFSIFQLKNSPEINLCFDEYDFVNNRYRLANKILYDMVEKHFSNKNDDEIVAKTWLIGRSYAAAIERRTNAEEMKDGEEFYYDHVAPAIKNSSIDDEIGELKNEKRINERNFDKILLLHKNLVKCLENITDQNKRSFASKYLHFHLPQLFFIYDSIVASNIDSFVLKKEKVGKWQEMGDVKYDVEYCKFFFKALCIYNHLFVCEKKEAFAAENKRNDSYTRIVDNILLRFKK